MSLPDFTDAELAAIVERLKSGRPLDDQYKLRLFQQGKEAEVVYAGKEPRGSVLAGTMGVPLQVLRTFGSASDWANKLVFGDNLQALKTLLEMKRRGELRNADGSKGVRLCYIDPPFATKREYRGKKGQLAYRDKVEGAEFIEFLRKRLIFIHELLTDDGSLYLHLDTNKVHYMKVVLDEIFGADNFRGEVVWKRSSAHSDSGQGSRHFGRIHDTILFYSKSERYRWTPQHTVHSESYVDSKYKQVEPETGRRFQMTDITGPGGAAKGNPRYELMGVTRYWRYSKETMQRLVEEGRILQSKPGAVPRYKRYLDEQEGLPLQDVWTDISPVNSMAKDRIGYPTQKPLELIERILAASSSEGDLVLDCFVGSGTTPVACERLDRRWIGVDCGKLAIYTTQGRLLSMHTGTGKARKRVEPRPFELVHAGLYDNTLLDKLKFRDFEDFALELFGCTPATDSINGIPINGTRGGDPVHVFPFETTKAEMGAEYIETLHERIGDRVNQVVYVIAPDSHCDPGLFENMITHDGVTYFILRVPYSVIEALHEREFRPLGQPVSRDQINDALDTYGFDFIELPQAKITAKKLKDTVRLTISEFRRGGLDPDDFADLEDSGRDDLSLAMVDLDYQGNGFELDDHLFGEDFRAAGWTWELPVADCGARIQLVLIDTYGNELRQTIELAKATKAPTLRPAARTRAAAK